MILHLLKTDWQRLRRPILGVWIILLLTSLPWIFQTLASFTVPWAENGTWNGSTPEFITDAIRAQRLRAEPIRFLIAIATFALSTAIGMHGLPWQAASPIRVWQRFAAKLLSLFAFIVGPQLLFGSLILSLHDFPPSALLAASLSTALSLTLLHATTALFAYQCGSIWTWLVGVVSLLGISLVLSSAFSFEPILAPFTDPWAGNRGPQLWVFCLVSAAALVLLPRILRCRPSTPLAITAAVAALILGSFTARQAPTTAVLPVTPDLPAEELSSITVVANPESTRAEPLATSPGTLQVVASPETAGITPTGSFVTWFLPDGPDQWTQRYPGNRSKSDFAAMNAALPDPIMKSDTLLGGQQITRNFPDTDLIPPNGLTTPITGHLWRYEALVDLPFGETTAITRDGAITLATRRIATADGRLMLDLALQAPALGISRNPMELTWWPAASRAYRFVLHFPVNQVCIPLFDTLERDTPIPGGAAWTRRVLESWEPDNISALDLRGARLIILKPVTLAYLDRTLTITPPVEYDRDARFWALSRNYHLGLDAYLTNHRPFRPDPATCTEDEFARYLRVASACVPEELAAHDLAEYAPRFSHLITLHGIRSPVADAIDLGTPDREKDQVIQALHDDPRNVAAFAKTLSNRGWNADSADLLIKALERNSSRFQVTRIASAIAMLEDPSTYPVLLTALERTRSFQLYQIIRELPDIEPQLTETIDKISSDLSPIEEFSKVRHGIYFPLFDPLKAPLHHGNALALTKALELRTMLPSNLKGFEFIRRLSENFHPEPSIPPTFEAWSDFLEGKTAADFTHDRLTHKWHAPSN